MKRTRYQLIAENRTGHEIRLDILAYDAEHVMRYAERRGLYNITVDRAPKRRARGAGQPATWAVDERALRAACAAMGVTWKVNITRSSSRSHRGVYRPSSATMARRVHNITVDKLADPKLANITLLHELRHAAQAEAAGDWATYVRQWNIQKFYRYARRPWEIEANAAAKQYAPLFKVAVPV